MKKYNSVSFRPNNLDSALIEKLIEEGINENLSDLLRDSLIQYAKKNLTREQYTSIVFDSLDL